MLPLNTVVWDGIVYLLCRGKLMIDESIWLKSESLGSRSDSSLGLPGTSNPQPFLRIPQLWKVLYSEYCSAYLGSSPLDWRLLESRNHSPLYHQPLCQSLTPVKNSVQVYWHQWFSFSKQRLWRCKFLSERQTILICVFILPSNLRRKKWDGDGQRCRHRIKEQARFFWCLFSST